MKRPITKSRLELRLVNQIVDAGLQHPKRELMFHPTRRWRFDFAWSEQMLAVEVQGGTYTGGRHVRGQGYEEDCRKMDEAVLLGWRVMYFTRAMIESGEALEYIQMALSK